MLVAKETINKPETIFSDLIGTERRILGGNDEHSFLNKGNGIQVSGKAVSPWWLMIDIQSNMNVITNKALVKEIRHTHGQFARVH